MLPRDSSIDIIQIQARIFKRPGRVEICLRRCTKYSCDCIINVSIIQKFLVDFAQGVFPGTLDMAKNSEYSKFTKTGKNAIIYLVP